jgi:hypothetical protein
MKVLLYQTSTCSPVRSMETVSQPVEPGPSAPLGHPVAHALRGEVVGVGHLVASGGADGIRERRRYHGGAVEAARRKETQRGDTRSKNARHDWVALSAA